MYKVAQMAHDGLARVIRPVHMMADGDTIFAVSTSQLELSSEHYSLVDVVGEMCAEAVERAVIRTVKSAKSVTGIPALSESAYQ
jgi:L-aminopeptidase/D-esterase